MAGSITSLLLLHFSISDVVHCCYDWEIGTMKVLFFCPFLLSFGLPFYFLIFSTMSRGQ
ncbi:hypothetical protein NC653_022059 [Populus alba x Populus x berolinensis]|uniref:Uncharacterized protein n=1 Tax=Populus alba x Populus x berolinensis TaxID=444605 RepID=A0AAD6VUM6_9ROSI|nr:hypothetical protein NC653_022059 [Populus alba x Populus x berolinensis]